MNTTESPFRTEKSIGASQAPSVVSAMELLGAAKAVVIEHQGQRYELRLTRNGKLILTK